MTTSRDFGKLYDLADMFQIKHTKISHHYGKNKFLKVCGLIIRSIHLILFIRRIKPNLALNHGSRTQTLAAKLLKIKCITAIDYEYTQSLPFVCPTLTLLPQVLYNKSVHGDSKDTIGYPGIKEDVYIRNYIPDERVMKDLRLNSGGIVVTIRPPATEAHYHNKQSDEFFNEIVKFLSKNNSAQIIILPRTNKQEISILNKYNNFISDGKIIIPQQAYNGLDVIWFSDLVISGGGTMIREATALGVPAYSFFQGKIGAVDEYLSKIGKLVLLKKIEEIPLKINLITRRRPIKPNFTNNNTLNFIIKTIESQLNSNELSSN